jgi:hypothetical protein
MPPSLTTRDEEILDALSHRVRVLSAEQIGRTWWAKSATPRQQAITRMKVLTELGLVSQYQALAHPEIPLLEPVLSWRRGEPPPDFARAAYRLQARWTKPFTSVTCFIATKRAGRISGGSGGRRSRTSEQTHDIHLASVFLRYRSVSPELIRQWTSEATILERRNGAREKLPDAMILDGAQRRVIEFGGAYGKEKIEGFHNYCVNEHLPYEIW